MSQNCPLCQKSTTEQVLLENKDWRIILAHDQGYSMLRVIWQAHAKEMSDLSAVERDSLMRGVFVAENALRTVLLPDKINLASLGNAVPHLHWHVIPRWKDDAHFPHSIWGEKQREPSLHRPVVDSVALQKALRSD